MAERSWRRGRGRWLWLSVWLVLAGPAGPRGGEAPPAEEVRGLVDELGSSDWARRESAQARLLQAGVGAVPALEQAARAGNPELAERARHILGRIDPEVVRLDIAEISVSRPLRWISGTVLEGTAGPEAIVLVPRGTVSRPSFEAWAQIPAEGQLRIEIEEVGSGAERTPLRRPLRAPDAISLVRIAEESVYRRAGLRIERTRDLRLTLAWPRTGRASALPPDPGPGLPGSPERWTARLLEQARSESPAVRTEAIEILAALGVPEAEPTFREAARDPAVRLPASLGLGAPESAVEALRLRFRNPLPGEEDAGGAGIDLARPLGARLIPALRIVEERRGAALEALLERLPSSDPFDAHLSMALLADLANGRKLSGEELARVLDLVTSPGFLESAPWDDPETENLAAAALGLLDPADPEGRRGILSFVAEMPTLATAPPGPGRPSVATCFHLWLRAASKIEPVRPRAIGRWFRRVLSEARSAEAITEAAPLIELYLAGLEPPDGSPPDGSPPDDDPPDDELSARQGEGGTPALPTEFLRTCDVLRLHLESGDPDLAVRSHQCLLRLSQARRLARGELAPLVSMLVDAGAAAAAAADPDSGRGQTTPGVGSILVRQNRDEIARWTGVPAGPSANAQASGFDPSPWRKWLGDPDAVAAREEALLRASATASARHVCYQFDLEIAPGGKAAPPQRKPRAFEVLDARRIEVETGKTKTIRDRWGNPMVLLVEATSGLAGPASGRLRVNRRSSFALETPVFWNADGRETSVRAVSLSNAARGARVASSVRGDLPSRVTLVHFVPAERDDPEAASAEDPAALWRRFVSSMLDPGPDPSPQRVSSILTLVGELDIDGRGPVLRRILESSPSVDVARALHEAGDPAGLEFLRARIADGSPDQRIAAAIAVAETAGPEGADVVIRLLRDEPQAYRRHAYRALGALDACLQRLEATDPARTRILDFVHEGLDDPTFQYRLFGILEREAGTDFGYKAARGLQAPADRDRAVREAISRAREARTKARH